MGFAGAVAYTVDAEGSALLLEASEDGSVWNAFRHQIVGEAGAAAAAATAAAAAALCVGTAGLFAPEGCLAEEAEPHILSKLQAGKGVHRLSTDADVLFLIPTRRVEPPAGGRLEWVPASEALQALYGKARRRLSKPLRPLLCTASGKQALQKISQAKAPARTGPEQPEDATPTDSSVPRKVATNIFLGDTPACHNTELLQLLCISRVLLLLGDGAAEDAGSELVAAASATAVAIGAELAVVRGATAAVRDGAAGVLLREACEWMAPAVEAEEGGLLVAGELRPTQRISPAWLVAAYVGSTAAAHDAVEKGVSRAFGECQRLLPACRMSAQLALEASSRVYVEVVGKPRRKGGAGGGAGGGGGGGAGGGIEAQVEPDSSGDAGLCASGVPPDELLKVAADAATPTATATAADDGDGGDAAAAAAAAAAAVPPAPAAASSATTTDVAAATATSPPPPPAAQPPAARHFAFRCSKCRLPLFGEELLEEHEVGDGQRAFRQNKRDGRADVSGTPSCTSYFLHDAALHDETAASLAQLDGKLCCPKCNARLGSYCWSGAQCSCGAWVAPAVQVVKSKVDRCAPRPAPAVPASVGVGAAG